MPKKPKNFNMPHALRLAQKNTEAYRKGSGKGGYGQKMMGDDPSDSPAPKKHFAAATKQQPVVETHKPVHFITPAYAGAASEDATISGKFFGKVKEYALKSRPCFFLVEAQNNVWRLIRYTGVVDEKGRFDGYKSPAVIEIKTEEHKRLLLEELSLWCRKQLDQKREHIALPASFFKDAQLIVPATIPAITPAQAKVPVQQP